MTWTGCTLDFLLRQAMQAVLTQRLFEAPRSALMVSKNCDKWVGRDQELRFVHETPAHASGVNHCSIVQRQLGVVHQTSISSAHARRHKVTSFTARVVHAIVDLSYGQL